MPSSKGTSLNSASSIGNYFLSAAQIFFRSLPSAIFLFSSITSSQVSTISTDIPAQLTPTTQANIIPVIVTNHTVTIAAELVRLPSYGCSRTNMTHSLPEGQRRQARRPVRDLAPRSAHTQHQRPRLRRARHRRRPALPGRWPRRRPLPERERDVPGARQGGVPAARRAYIQCVFLYSVAAAAARLPVRMSAS